jgi:hypothetical protein
MGMTGMTWWTIPPAAVLAVPGGRQPVPALKSDPPCELAFHLGMTACTFRPPPCASHDAGSRPIKRDAVNEVEIAATLDQGRTHRCFSFP